MRAGRGLAFPLPAARGRAGLLGLHNTLSPVVKWEYNHVVYVIKATGENWHTIIWHIKSENGATGYSVPVGQLCLDCTTYANLLLAKYFSENAFGLGFKASVAGIGPKSSLGTRYGMVKKGHLSKSQVVSFFKTKANKKSLYFLDIVAGHAVIGLHLEDGWKAIHCSYSHGGPVTQSLMEYIKTSKYIESQGALVWSES